MDVKGYAKNCDDSSVEVATCGEQEWVKLLIAWLKAGKLSSTMLVMLLIKPAQ
ncbi:MAG: acylphosphatase [Candidatus Malihini olakiniferum]